MSREKGSNSGCQTTALWLFELALVLAIPAILIGAWGGMTTAIVDTGQEADVQVPSGEDVRGFLDRPCACASAMWAPLLPVIAGVVKELARMAGRV